MARKQGGTVRARKRNKLGTENGITLHTVERTDTEPGYIHAASVTGTEWKVYRRGRVNGAIGSTGASYDIEDTDGTPVGATDTLASLYALLNSVDTDMARLLEVEQRAQENG